MIGPIITLPTDEIKELFNEKLKGFIGTKTVEPLIATLSSHASIRFDQKDEYTFCPNPFDYICTANLYDDERFNDEFISGLGKEINDANNNSMDSYGFHDTPASSGGFNYGQSISIFDYNDAGNNPYFPFRQRSICC